MNILRKADNKFKLLGFRKIDENVSHVYYEKTEHEYIHCLDIHFLKNNNYVVQSYEKECNSENFNNTVWITKDVLKAINQKILERTITRRLYERHWNN